jgi:predicted Zn finger-like uncharacterized protein
MKSRWGFSPAPNDDRDQTFEGPAVSEAIQVECPHCSAQLRVRDKSILGKRVRCPSCKNPVATPEPPDTANGNESFLSGLGNLQDEDEYGPASQQILPARRPRRQPTPDGDFLDPRQENPRQDTPPKKKKKKKRSQSNPDELPFILWPVFGLAGGALGGAIWVAIAYAIHRELGIIAWAVGAMTGFAVAIAAGHRAGTGSGLLAAGLAFSVIIMSKFCVALLIVNQAAALLDKAVATPEQVMMLEARAIASEAEKKGTKLKWPPGKSLDVAEELSDFPEAIADQAQRNWAAQTPRIKQHQKSLQQVNEIGKNPVGKGLFVVLVFLGSFRLFDLLWFFLAMGSAFRLGRGTS